MGEVYKARDTRLGRDVAVKVLSSDVAADPARLRRFETEARSASSLNHPNIVTVYDVGHSNGTSFIAMELVDGRTLRELQAGRPLPTKTVLAIAAQIADGLAKAHDAGIVHRDLKPENVMVRKDGFAKILDFGLAKLTDEDESQREGTLGPTRPVATEPGVVMGTAGYMSPEQARGRPLDFRSDQFSFGSIVYEMATGRRAFERASTPETLAAIIREEPEPIRTAAAAAPQPLSWFVERCLAKDPDERYASTRDLARDLARLRDSLSESSLSGAPVVAESAKSRRWLFWAAAGLGTVAAIAVAATWKPIDEPPAFRALTFRRGSMGGARFGPDGQTVIYAAAWQGKPMQLYSTRVDSMESTALPLPSADLLAISPAGKMAILRRGGAAPVVAEGSLAGGAPRDLYEGNIEVEYSPVGERTCLTRGGKLESPVGTVLYDPGADRDIGSPRFSPDGHWIAFIEQTGKNSASIAVVDLAGKKRTLSEGWETTTNLAWHPVTGEVWFSAREFAGSGVVNLHAVSLSGRHRVVARGPLLLLIQDIARDGTVLLRADDWVETTMGLLSGAAKESDLTWFDDSRANALSSDGQTLLFTEGGIAGGGNGAVYLRRTDGAPAVRIGDGHAEALSPDQKWIATLRNGALVLLPAGAGESKAIPTPGFEVQGAGWFPDGKRILFFAFARGQRARVYVADLAGGAPRAITPEGFVGRQVSPDGRFFLARDEQRHVFLYPVDGGEPRPLPGIAPSEAIAGFDAAGTGAFVASLHLPLKIVRYDIASGRREVWKDIQVSDPAGVVQLNTIVLTPDGKSYAYTFFRMLSRLYVVHGLK